MTRLLHPEATPRPWDRSAGCGPLRPARPITPLSLPTRFLLPPPRLALPHRLRVQFAVQRPEDVGVHGDGEANAVGLAAEVVGEQFKVHVEAAPDRGGGRVERHLVAGLYGPAEPGWNPGAHSSSAAATSGSSSSRPANGPP